MARNCEHCKKAKYRSDLLPQTAEYSGCGVPKNVRLCNVHRDFYIGWGRTPMLVQGTQMIGDEWAPESGKVKKMAPGGGKFKGSDFERDTAYELSKWISKGARTDLFRRTVLSGGQWTMKTTRDKEYGEVGDLGANHPLAFPFVEKYVVECKAWADLELIDFIWGKYDLYDAMEKVMHEAELCGKQWLLVAKQNFRPVIALFATPPDMIPIARTNWHQLFNGTVVLMKFQELLKCDSEAFITMYNAIDVPGGGYNL